MIISKAPFDFSIEDIFAGTLKKKNAGYLGADKDLIVVGIALSAGGIAPLLELIKNAFCHKSMCFVVIPHLHRSIKSGLRNLIADVSDLEVIEIGEGVRLEACKIFVLPGNTYAEVNSYTFSTKARPMYGPNLAGNVFFCSLAASLGKNAIGVVLSGAAVGGHGASGIRSIRQGRGRTYVQKPETARFPDMPNLAIATNCVDFILPAGLIGLELSLINWAS
jgi:two-component system CheB/CheR fusion protein